MFVHIKKMQKKKERVRNRMWEDNTTFVNWHLLFSVVNYSKNIVQDEKYGVIFKIEKLLSLL